MYFAFRMHLGGFDLLNVRVAFVFVLVIAHRFVARDEKRSVGKMPVEWDYHQVQQVEILGAAKVFGEDSGLPPAKQ